MPTFTTRLNLRKPVGSDLVNVTSDLSDNFEKLDVADGAVVHLAGAETISGVKTFGAAPIFGAGAIPQIAVANLVADLASKELPASAQQRVNDHNAWGGAHTSLLRGQGAGYFGQGGTHVAVLDGFGNAIVFFPLAFPTGCSGVVVSNGDVGAASFYAEVGAFTATYFSYHCEPKVGSLAGATTRINWVAIGN